MPRLASGRDRYLTPAEIAAEALRQFDGGQAPSTRSLAAALGVTTTAIYHHFASQAEITRAAVDLVYSEIGDEVLGLMANPFSPDEDPVDVLVASGLATRRVFLRHCRVAPHLADLPTGNENMAATLALVTLLLERIGLRGQDAAQAYHTYASYVLGSVLLAATRANAALDAGLPAEAFRTPRRDGAREDTRELLDQMMDLSATDPARDEAMFVHGLGMVVAALAAVAADG